ncbi:hypothetical protein BGX33_008244 [Mortierella sp. NVP41]|nr:hypothetical protein BGX33_008244 [Mortierella sp. NVP41]
MSCIDFSIFERSEEVKPVGVIMSLNVGVSPVLEQLGLYEALQKVSLPLTSSFKIFKGDGALTADLKTFPSELHIHFNKMGIGIEQDERKASITYSDGTTYSDDVLVGADGAYSAVRQGLYKQMQEEKVLPPLDAQDLNRGFICMVGITKPLDPAKYPSVDDGVANTNQVVVKNNNYS